jgi:hypothetical protein
MGHISDILEEISSLLNLSSYVNEAAWVQQRAIQLRSVPNEAERMVILSEVKGKIAGMGSLSDIYLLPTNNAGITKEEANYRLGELIIELDKQITDALKA